MDCEYDQNNPQPIPDGCELKEEIRLDDGKFIIRLLHYTNSQGVYQRWQALRWGEDWPACPYPDWRPDNLLLAVFFRVVQLEDKVKEYTKLENYTATGRFNPESSNFDSITFATRLLEGKNYD